MRRLDGVVVPGGETFSFWKQVGRATARRGFVEGRELREGCMVPSVGGGLCQLSNALYDAALRAGFEIVERHPHTKVVPGSLAAVGRDATVFWNYVDLRFRPHSAVRIEATVGTDSLTVRFWGRRRSGTPAVAAPAQDAAAVGSHPSGDCATCGVEQCFRHAALRRRTAAPERSAFLLDAYWPEYDAYVARMVGPEDIMALPLDGMRRGFAKYRWDTSRTGTVHENVLLTALRSYQSKRLAEHGAERQRLLLRWAQRMGERFAARLPYDVTHVVVMQHMLPALWTGGFLGGRTFDVLMTGLPLRELQRRLDTAYALHPESRTLGDFRCDDALIEAEETALGAASRIVTPHAAIATMFGARTVRLPWLSSAPVTQNGTVRGERTVLFPASTLGRAGAYELRDVARALDLHVILTGPDLEAPGFWNGVSVERTSFSDGLGRARAVVLPAFVEHQPRRLLLASRLGMPVVASEACGIDACGNLVTVAAGDVVALGAAIGRSLHRT
ncbi:MAG: VanW family protein [Candidatus Eremiobacteraeota bacterium]|nr:VanW family protein [Candidatus Eremiobacteraeota bacterium]